MLKGVRITFSLIALSIAIYSFISGNRDIMPYMFIFLGAMAFTIGVEEIKKHRQSSNILAFMAGAGALLIGFSELFR
ncbi:YczI family protein [Bacillus nitratireducens]|uniref:YczI family protein n=1 Tax=Bacillus nitratireducens TaxID=2026193 RepID=UPI0008FE5482|nr:YczI family protein [Bacillus nitratireducens]OJD54993.1 hypothetical protein BAU23_27310 [Bacillus nitratireducens]